MKITRIFFVLFLLFFTSEVLLSQGKLTKHKGFHGSITIGPSYGQTYFSTIDLDAPSKEYKYQGLGYNVDLKAGYAVSNRTVVHATFNYYSLNGNRGKSQFEDFPSEQKFFDIFMYGLGATYYTSRLNLFYTLSAGICSIDDGNEDLPNFGNKSNKEAGILDRIGMQFKFGREWRINSDSKYSANIEFGIMGSWYSYQKHNSYDVFNIGIFFTPSFH